MIDRTELLFQIKKNKIKNDNFEITRRKNLTNYITQYI